jgi:hypothetical protein
MSRNSIFLALLLILAVGVLGARPARAQVAKPNPVRIDHDAAGDVKQRTAVTKDGSTDRRWTCRAAPAELQADAARAYARLLPDTSEAYREFATELGIPVARDMFIRDFSPVTDPADCRRLGASLAREGYPIPDGVRAFRIGRVYFVPGLEGGVLVAQDGGVIGGFRAPR